MKKEKINFNNQKKILKMQKINYHNQKLKENL